jgi:four helix bundle protein
MQDFRRLEVWAKAHDLALFVYKVTEGFPRHELFGLTGQIRRAAVSVPANIAEGCGRTGDRELVRYLRIAMGSASELEYYGLLAHDLGLLTARAYRDIDSRDVEVKRMLASLITKLSPRTTTSRIARRPVFEKRID